MEGVYGWIQNIVYYLIFVTVLLNLLPSSRYEKYLRLFAGCILILLVLQPLTGGLRLENKISGMFEKFSFQNEAGELQGELLDMENRRLEELVSRYEEETAGDIARMAALEGMDEKNVSVDIDGDPESPSFGAVTQVSIVLKNRPGGRGDSREGAFREQDGQPEIQAGSGRVIARAGAEEGVGEEKEPESPGLPIEEIKKVEKVKIGPESTKNGAGEQRKDEKEEKDGAAEAAGAYPDRWKSFRQQIAGYYQVEEQYVEIRVEDE